MNNLKNLIEGLRKSREKCPWSKEQEIKEHIIELEREIQEAKEAVGKNDFVNLKEELGDVLMDLIFISIIAEEQKLFSFDGMIESADTKLRRRKPWVFGNETIATKKEAIKRWDEIKAKEKGGK